MSVEDVLGTVTKQLSPDPTTLAAFYPAARSMTWPANSGSEWVESAAVRQVSAGYWSVTVAARVTSSSKDGESRGSLRYFQAPVRAMAGTKGTASGCVATALPAEVAATSRARPNMRAGGR
ncbi:hypothetical protein OG422_29260 [Streptomyces sp. NBC_01525]|uniref:hypothetical protein n=1 Tax=Streptomyces TaxID=1883 RepID=UPI00163D53E5|nr:hypothetical protein [Streptomyces benahoarensis]